METIADSWDSETNVDSLDSDRKMETNGDSWVSERLLDTDEIQRD